MIPVSVLIDSKGSNVWTVTPDTTVYRALELLAERNIGVLPVVENETLVGIFSERDYARRVILYGRNSKETRVSEVMTADVKTASPDDSVEQCMKIVVENGFRHLPIVQNGNLAGIISSTDLLAEVIRSREMEIGQLENLITGTGEIT